MARTLCGPGWTGALVAVHVISDLLIFCAYMMIPFLMWAVHAYCIRRGKIPELDASAVVCFLLFVLSCGATHAMDAMMFQWPAYRLSGLVLAVCAFLSMVSMAVFAMRLVREVRRG